MRLAPTPVLSYSDPGAFPRQYVTHAAEAGFWSDAFQAIITEQLYRLGCVQTSACDDFQQAFMSCAQRRTNGQTLDWGSDFTWDPDRFDGRGRAS